MKCPKCNITLLIAERQGVEIDYCPDCRGIWLDRGELDKILERSNSIGQSDTMGIVQSPQPAISHQPLSLFPHGDHHDKHHHDMDRHSDGSHRRKKKSLLMDLFDF